MRIAFEAADQLMELWIKLERKILLRCPQAVDSECLAIMRIDGKFHLTYNGKKIGECSLSDKIAAVELVPKLLNTVDLKIQSMNDELSAALNKLRRYVHDAK
jgi:hypothetical protein